MNDTQADAFQEILNEVRSLREAVERGPETDRPLALKPAEAPGKEGHTGPLGARWEAILFAIRRWGTRSTGSGGAFPCA